MQIKAILKPIYQFTRFSNMKILSVEANSKKQKKIYILIKFIVPICFQPFYIMFIYMYDTKSV